jgi:uncharacterized protein (DUF433 family)
MDIAEKLYILEFEEDCADIVGAANIDRRELPQYSVAEVALYLHIPEKTLRSWLFGRPYTAGGQTVMFKPLIAPADPTGNRLSFYNLVEAHILKSTRERDEVPMHEIRAALDYAIADDPSPHPLITQRFETEGSALFVDKLEHLVNYSKQGQLAFKDLMRGYLDRIDRDTIGPSGLYPFVPQKPQSKVVVIKPGVSSGVPTITGTGISVPILYGRFTAGDSIADLADDYGLTNQQVEDAIEYLSAA